MEGYANDANYSVLRKEERAQRWMFIGKCVIGVMNLFLVFGSRRPWMNGLAGKISQRHVPYDASFGSRSRS